MSSQYIGTKFQTVFKDKTAIKNDNISTLIKWCNKFAELGLSPKLIGGFGGNLSFRTEQGFIITASGVNLKNLSENDFVEVIEADILLKKVKVNGTKLPSSESLLHYFVYSQKAEINAVFHGHDDKVLKKCKQLELPTTKQEQPYGSVELIEEVGKILQNYFYLVLKNHGFLSLGETMDKAGNLALQIHHNTVFSDSDILKPQRIHHREH